MTNMCENVLIGVSQVFRYGNSFNQWPLDCWPTLAMVSGIIYADIRVYMSSLMSAFCSCSLLIQRTAKHCFFCESTPEEITFIILHSGLQWDYVIINFKSFPCFDTLQRHVTICTMCLLCYICYINTYKP